MIILEAVVGSRGMGLNVANSDHDFMAVTIEPQDELIPLVGKPFECLVTKEPDRQVFGLHKYLKMALIGNPTALGLLFSKPTFCDKQGKELLELRDKLLSRRAGAAFLGYMDDQLKRLKGEKGQKRVNRPELERKCGYDTKYAMHTARLCLHGIELMEEGRMSFPMQPTHRALLMDIRNGELEFKETLAIIDTLAERLKDSLGNSKLPIKPDTDAVQDWLNDAYLEFWVR